MSCLFVNRWANVTMYSYLSVANDVFRDINVGELDKDTNQARIFLKKASLHFMEVLIAQEASS